MRLIRLVAAWLAAAALGHPAIAEPLPAVGADAARASVSGLSSGGFMAVQYGVAYSASTTGVGVIAGGPYGCASIYLALFLRQCMQGKPDGATSFRSARDFSRAGVIDPVAGVARQRVYLFSGTKDTIVAQTVVDGLRDFYRAAGVTPERLLYVRDVAAGHGFFWGEADSTDCAASAVMFIFRCTSDGTPFDQPGAILAQLHGPLRPKAATLSATPAAFDQTEFASASAGMARTGYVYVPAACRAAGAKCAVHVVFHGCLQSTEYVGDAIYAKVGYNRWGESNGLILLYPQVDDGPRNPYGCWDWWGYTGTNFLFRSAAQMAAVRKMVERLGSGG